MTEVTDAALIEFAIEESHRGEGEAFSKNEDNAVSGTITEHGSDNLAETSGVSPPLPTSSGAVVHLQQGPSPQGYPLSPEEFSNRVKLLKKSVINAATKVKDTTERDISLISILRECRDELDAAEATSARAADRLKAAKVIYSHCARILAGYTPLEVRTREKKRMIMLSHAPFAKRIRREVQVLENNMDTVEPKPDTNNEDANKIVLPDNPIHMPPIHNLGGGMSAELVSSHRDNFYKLLIGVPFAEVDEYEPSRTSANLKSKSQLVEWIYIARHCNTGADGLDAGAFRAKHKTWYSRMKPVTENLGRRTGIHLRTMEGDDGETVTVLCRYTKDGTKSVVYLDVGRIFDAIFEIHSLELGHRGRDVVKSRADERYANIPDGQVRAFLDTCPFCMARRGGNRNGI